MSEHLLTIEIVACETMCVSFQVLFEGLLIGENPLAVEIVACEFAAGGRRDER